MSQFRFLSSTNSHFLILEINSFLDTTNNKDGVISCEAAVDMEVDDNVAVEALPENGNGAIVDNGSEKAEDEIKPQSVG